jgi:transposase
VPFVASSPDPEVPEKAHRRKFSAQDKKRILEEVDRATVHGGIGAVLRREGPLVYSSACARRRPPTEPGVRFEGI